MYDKDIIYKRIKRYGMKSKVLFGAQMAPLTSFKIGGAADILVIPDNIADIVRVQKLCTRERIPLLTLGNCTNVLVRGGGIRGIVLMLGGGGLCEMRRERNSIFVGAGALLKDAADFAANHELSGLEFSSGIPGTVGGAVFMNAGAYGRDISNVVARTVYLDGEGNIGLLDASAHDFSYRNSAFQKNGYIILETEFLLCPAAREDILRTVREYSAKRAVTQPLDMPSAGSVFRRPAQKGVFVGPLIEACGLKGSSEGGAQVSLKHAGFIVNTGGATAGDVLKLIGRVQVSVRERFSVELVPEIRVVGEGESLC